MNDPDLSRLRMDEARLVFCLDQAEAKAADLRAQVERQQAAADAKLEAAAVRLILTGTSPAICDAIAERCRMTLERQKQHQQEKLQASPDPAGL